MENKVYDKNLLYYKREISFLRQMGNLFAAQHPKIARRLGLPGIESSDPHVERLLESFAFLTSFLQQDIDNQFPRVSEALLGLICPNLLNPIPPLTVAQFKTDPQKSMTTADVIPSGFRLYTETDDDQTCQFQTTYPVDLWPIDVVDIALEKTEKYPFGSMMTSQPSLIRMTLRSQKTPFNKLAPATLRFFINAPRLESFILYNMLFAESPPIFILCDQCTTPISLAPDALRPVGLTASELVIPTPENGNAAYTLLQEYFNFPEKFMFFDLNGLDVSSAVSEIHIFIPVPPNVDASAVSYSPSTFALGCTPIINLFPKITEPIRFDHHTLEYRLVPDYKREVITEIHSLDQVYSSPVDSVTTHEIFPYYSFNHVASNQEASIFWNARRVASINPDVPGSDMLLSFVNWNMQPDLPPSDVVYARALCTNRHLAPLVPAQTLLKTDKESGARTITCLMRPTKTIYPPSEGETQWQLISTLALNYLSCSGNPNSLKGLKELLAIYSHSTTSKSQVDINSLIEMMTEEAVQRIMPHPWQGFVKGTAITLLFDEARSGGMGSFLLASVLNAFFGLYTHINTFTQLTINSTIREGTWKKWPARSGSKPLV